MRRSQPLRNIYPLKQHVNPRDVPILADKKQEISSRSAKDQGVPFSIHGLAQIFVAGDLNRTHLRSICSEIHSFIILFIKHE